VIEIVQYCDAPLGVGLRQVAQDLHDQMMKTPWPAFIGSTTEWEPMQPVPPVIGIFSRASNGSHDFHRFAWSLGNKPC